MLVNQQQMTIAVTIVGKLSYDLSLKRRDCIKILLKLECRSLCSATNDPIGTGLFFGNNLSQVKDLTMTNKLKRCNDQMMAQTNIVIAIIVVGIISMVETTKSLIQRRLFYQGRGSLRNKQWR